MPDPRPGTSGNDNGQHTRRLTTLTGFLLLLALAVYIVAIVTGRVPADRRIDASSLAFLVLGCVIAIFLLRPELVERVTRFEALGWKLEMEHRQNQQSNKLKDIELILPVLLPEPERRHLTNLARHRTAAYKGNHELRTELRRLRSLKLIDMQPDQAIHMMADGSVFDLARFVRLTQLGERWAERMTQLENENAKEAQATAASDL